MLSRQSTHRIAGGGARGGAVHSSGGRTKLRRSDRERKERKWESERTKIIIDKHVLSLLHSLLLLLPHPHLFHLGLKRRSASEVRVIYPRPSNQEAEYPRHNNNRWQEEAHLVRQGSGIGWKFTPSASSSPCGSPAAMRDDNSSV